MHTDKIFPTALPHQWSWNNMRSIMNWLNATTPINTGTELRDLRYFHPFANKSELKSTVHLVSCLLTLRGRLYRRRYQLVFFKTSAKDIKNTPSILVVQISVIHQLKLWSVYFFCVHSRIQQNFVVLEKKKKTNRMRSLSSPSPRAALQKTSLKWTVTQRKLNTLTWELYL